MFTYYNAAVTTSSTPVKQQTETPQRVQIMRTPDGRITVKGLLPGQQLVQYPDGKLQVMTNAQLQSSGLTVKPPPPPTTTPTKQPIIKPTSNTPLGKVVQGNQLKPVNQQQTSSPVKTQQVIVKTPGTPVVQKVTSPNTVVVSSGQVIQQQVVISGSPVIGTPGGQQVVKNVSCFSLFFFISFNSGDYESDRGQQSKFSTTNRFW